MVCAMSHHGYPTGYRRRVAIGAPRRARANLRTGHCPPNQATKPGGIDITSEPRATMAASRPTASKSRECPGIIEIPSIGRTGPKGLVDPPDRTAEFKHGDRCTLHGSAVRPGGVDHVLASDRVGPLQPNLDALWIRRAVAPLSAP